MSTNFLRKGAGSPKATESVIQFGFITSYTFLSISSFRSYAKATSAYKVRFSDSSALTNGIALVYNEQFWLIIDNLSTGSAVFVNSGMQLVSRERLGRYERIYNFISSFLSSSPVLDLGSDMTTEVRRKAPDKWSRKQGAHQTLALPGYPSLLVLPSSLDPYMLGGRLPGHGNENLIKRDIDFLSLLFSLLFCASWRTLYKR